MFFDASALAIAIDVIKQNVSFMLPSLFAYLGHFGVQIFIFCTGFGVAKSFANRDLKAYPRYLLKKVGTLYLLMFIGLIWYTIFNINTISFQDWGQLC